MGAVCRQSFFQEHRVCLAQSMACGFGWCEGRDCECAAVAMPVHSLASTRFAKDHRGITETRLTQVTVRTGVCLRGCGISAVANQKQHWRTYPGSHARSVSHMESSHMQVKIPTRAGAHMRAGMHAQVPTHAQEPTHAGAHTRRYPHTHACASNLTRPHMHPY